MKKSFAYLGPKGTFTEAAFLQMPIAQGAELIPAESVRAALNMVRADEVFGALVPIENSVEGSVATTLDELGHGDTLEIIDEISPQKLYGSDPPPVTNISSNDLSLLSTQVISRNSLRTNKNSPFP